jgi:hypothetical protein
MNQMKFNPIKRRWSGCNHVMHPKKQNIADSMHDCGGCEFIKICRITHNKQEWECNKYYNKMADNEVARLNELKRQNQ